MSNKVESLGFATNLTNGEVLFGYIQKFSFIFPFFSFEMKHSKQLEESKANSAAAIKELEHLQNEKRKMLMEHETAKLKELDESYSKEFNEWKNNLKPRKQVRNRNSDSSK